MTLQAMGVVEDSSLRNLKQIPYLAPPPPIQIQAGVTDEENTPNMRELVRAINTHMEMVNLEVTSNLNVAENVQVRTPPTNPPIEDAPKRPADDAVQFSPVDV